jgi:hypothetical protein
MTISREPDEFISESTLKLIDAKAPEIDFLPEKKNENDNKEQAYARIRFNNNIADMLRRLWAV